MTDKIQNKTKFDVCVLRKSKQKGDVISMVLYLRHLVVPP